MRAFFFTTSDTFHKDRSTKWQLVLPPEAIRWAWRSWLIYGILTLLFWSSAQAVYAQTEEVPLHLSWSSNGNDTTTSIAWGDVDGDGDLDLAVGNAGRPNLLYYNQGGVLSSNGVAISSEVNNTIGIAWGDVDGDGDLDLAAGNQGEPNLLYYNQGGVLRSNGVAISSEVNNTTSIAWGDVDGDGDLDLAVGNRGQPNQLYRNDGGTLSASAVWPSVEVSTTTSIAWGDVDGDGDLDLAVGNWGQPNLLYYNQGGVLRSNGVAIYPKVNNTTSIAWGDVDGDGDLDLAVGNQGQRNQLYRNDGGTLHLAWFAPEIDTTTSVAWGDVDGDGDLDLAVGNQGQRNQLYRNDGGTLSASAVWPSIEQDNVSSVAWGDVDGDGDLDLAVGNQGLPNRLYRNDGGTLSAGAVWPSIEQDNVSSVAWGDVDGDGDLDLAVGGLTNRLYHNDGGTLHLGGFAPESDDTTSIAWGDVDGDGDLDLAVGNAGRPNLLYYNQGGVLSDKGVAISSEVNNTTSIAWGDVDGDGDLDLAAGNQGEPNLLYYNQGGVLSDKGVAISSEVNNTTSIAWGDVDGDGDLDLAVGNSKFPNQLYRNDGSTLHLAWPAPENDNTTSVAWGDVDGDGDLDLAVGNWGQPNQIYRNDGGTLSASAVWSSLEVGNTTGVAWGDIDGDGDLDLAVGSSDFIIGNPGQPIRLYYNDGNVLRADGVELNVAEDDTRSMAWGDVDGDGDLDLAVGNLNTPVRVYHNGLAALATLGATAGVHLDLPKALGDAAFYAGSKIWTKPTLPIAYTLFHPKSNPVARVVGYYSLDGGSQWQEAKAVEGTIETGVLASSPYPTATVANTHTFVWDIAANGVMGQNDNVLFRLVAIPSLAPLRNQIPGPFLNGSYSTQSLPFRLRGTQVRVVDQEQQPVPQAIVYRLPAGNTNNGQLMGVNGIPFYTFAQGYLAGRGTLNLGDRILALEPKRVTGKYSLYNTSEPPTEDGVTDYKVSQSGIQTLTVSAANPLLLFNLDISLEWNASNDPLFLEQLALNLEKASASLYDWSDGQVALGQVTVYQDREKWEQADVHIFASNQVRPSANRGGIVTTTTVIDHPLFTVPITATKGEIRIGPIWNRYGDAGPIGDDWPRVLAHELGHYALFLEDTYLGLDPATGLLVGVDKCHGTAMSNPYDDNDGADSEFRRRDADWLRDCGNTLAELPDWELIELVYPFLHSPTPDNLKGPLIMPFAFTTVSVQPPPTSSLPALLVDDTIALGSADQQLGDGRAYLVRPGYTIIDLGRPNVSTVKARGAREGDLLCIFGTTHSACSSLFNRTPPLLTPHPLWAANVGLTWVSTTTVKIQATAPDSPALTAVLYPNGTTPQTVTLSSGVEKTIQLEQPTVEALVEIQGAGDRRMITSITAGDGPGRAYSHDGPGRAYSHDGPFISGDGRIVIYPPDRMPPNVFLALQTATQVPLPPAGRTAIGRAYQVLASSNHIDYGGGSIIFQYVGMDVLLSGQPEQNLAIYYSTGTTWQRLFTLLDERHNIASAPLPGAGLYALMAGFQVALPADGWNLVSYPLESPLPASIALASIEGHYTTAFGYDASNQLDPWELYFVGAPDWVNDLREFKPGRGYWIYATHPVTWFLTSQATQAVVATTTDQLPQPPATFYGHLRPDEDFTPAAGMTIRAFVDGVACGQGETKLVDGEVVYVINVIAADLANASGCGVLGRAVTFHIGDQPLSAAMLWDNSRVHLLDFKGKIGLFANTYYLPTISNLNNVVEVNSQR